MAAVSIVAQIAAVNWDAVFNAVKGVFRLMNNLGSLLDSQGLLLRSAAALLIQAQTFSKMHGLLTDDQ